MLHTLGFIHEHQRPDRDEYINILWKNVKKGRGGQLWRDVDMNLDEQKDFPYDFCSVTHYSRFIGSKVSNSCTNCTAF